MYAILIILGAFAGLWLASGSEELLGFGAGGLLGYLLARVSKLHAELDALRDLVNAAPRAKSAGAPAEKAKTVASRTPVPKPAGKPVSLYEQDPVDATEPAPATVSRGGPPASASLPGDSGPAPAPRRQLSPNARTAPSSPPVTDQWFEKAKEWLSTGNVPVKLGVIVSFFGVSFLLKYAVDMRLIVIPLEMRYIFVSIGAGILLGIGWRLREKMRVYALSLQGGGIGILYLTIFAAFRIHDLLPPWFAFLLLVLLTVFAGMLAVLQDARWLAILGTVGGFLAPVLVSTGAGNHVALFSYYLLLNAAILATAWFRSWRSLNLIGFVFTFGVGTLWGYEYYRPELFASTEPFLVAFFLFYQAIAVISAHRQPTNLRGIVDATLIFGTPVIAFALQAELVADTEYGLAISAIGMAVIYTLIGAWLHRERRPEMRLLIESFVALAVAFATIAIPLALDDRWTAVAWALEGAALVWVGVRQGGLLARLTGVLLLFASGVAFLHHGWTYNTLPVLNGNYLGGTLIGIASLFAALRLSKDESRLPGQVVVSVLLLVWGVLWWSITGSVEILDHLGGGTQLHTLITFAAASGGLLAAIAARYRWNAARRTTLAYLPVMFLLSFTYLIEFGHLLVSAGWLSWLAAVGAHFFILKRYDNGRSTLEAAWHFTGVLLIAAMLSYEIYWRLDAADFSELWSLFVAHLVLLAATMFATQARAWFGWPVQRYWNAYFLGGGLLTVIVLALLPILGVSSSGDPAPLPYVPLLNPLDMLTIAALAVAVHLAQVARTTTTWFTRDLQETARILWAVTAFVLSTLVVVRGVRNIVDVDTGHGPFGSVAVQSALSIYWAVLGLAGMIRGARERSRLTWIVGTTLMAVVVIKLFLVDLGNTGTVARIVSFLGVGSMLLVVGYFAPAPPRAIAHAEDDNNE